MVRSNQLTFSPNAFEEVEDPSFRDLPLKLFKNIPQNMTLIYLKVSDESCKGLCIKFAACFTTIYDKGNYAGLYYCLNPTLCFASHDKTYIIPNIELFLGRWITILALNSIAQHQSCKVIMDINPFVPMSYLIQSNEEVRKDRCCDSASIYFNIWRQPQRLSYAEAEHICNQMGAELISPSSLEELSLLENIMVGSRFDKGQQFHLSPFRLYIFSGIHIGKKVLSILEYIKQLVVVLRLK